MNTRSIWYEHMDNDPQNFDPDFDAEREEFISDENAMMRFEERQNNLSRGN